MIKFFKITGNITLLLILLSMLALPTGFMGLMNYDEKSTVLSAQDTRINPDESAIKSLDDPEAQVPEYIREVILKMESEYYLPEQQEFIKDIERSEEVEQATPSEEITPTVIDNAE